MKHSAQIGLIGLGVMGSSLARNFASRKITVSVYNEQQAGEASGLAASLAQSSEHLLPFEELSSFIQSLESPRKVLLMIKAGDPVDAMLEKLVPILEEGDIIIDAGNSQFEDTDRRTQYCAEKQLEFVGMGVSGGEEGALKGPSLMPGGSASAMSILTHLLQSIAAKDIDGNPCMVSCQGNGAGHFVKMVHNGIEYGEMQLLAEVFDLLRSADYTQEQIADILESWSKNGRGSFLIEVTINVLRYAENGEPLLPKIKDAAKQKGTGSWTTKSAMELGVASSTISEAVHARIISSQKSLRTKLHQPIRPLTNLDIAQLEKAWSCASIINHHIGFEVIREAAQLYNWQINLGEVAHAWTNGCIIRSSLMNELKSVLAKSPSILEDEHLFNKVISTEGDLKEILKTGMDSQIALPVMSAAFQYLLSITRKDSPANLTQAQRDYFGAHQYERTDQPAGKLFHTNWKKS